MPSFVGSGPGSADALIGVQLNDLFEVVRFIAEGGMGRVYEGRNIASGEQVAIKVILGQYATDDQFMALFRREASALEKIGHDALVKYRALAFDRSRGVNYLAIEYVDGPSMAQVLNGAPAEPALVRRVLRRLALGLHAAHEAGVIHRDLSPDNVLLPGGNIERAKIIDFGIAKDNNPGEKSVVGEAFAGKFGYAAPEVFGKYKRNVGAWTDIYSLGLVIAALARGAPVAMGITIVDALEARDTVPDISDLPADLQPIVAKMLAPDPADRFQSMEEVADAADARSTMFMSTPAPVAGSSEGGAAFVKAEAVASVGRDAPKSRLPLVAIAGVAVAVIAAGAWFGLSGGEEAEPPGEMARPADGTGDADAVRAESTAVAGGDAVASAAEWATSAPQVFAALGALQCADVRIDGPPEAGRIRLAGWRNAATALPAAVAGWQLDGSGVAAINAPAPATCRVIDSIRIAAASTPDKRFSMPGSQILSLASLPRGADGTIMLDFKLADRPAGRLLFTSIDDRFAGRGEQVSSGDANRFNLDPSAIGFEAKTGRYLVAMVASPTELSPATASGAAPDMASACRSGDCELVSGWIEVR
ncbi:hypothetical protein GCM10007973_01540 [Polymorphobacter multimanifer]|nr:hypothetical protein GCM10007973_01540 [Polymorphobacter multimanifer]